MKSLLTAALLIASAQSFAFGLESYTGETSFVGGNHACTLTNETGSDLYIKRVEFNLTRSNTTDVIVTKSVHSVLAAGETMTVVSNATFELRAAGCNFLAR